MDTLRCLQMQDELTFAKEEAARLQEMLVMLAQGLDDARVLQLRIEMRVVVARIERITDELMQSDRQDSAARV